MSRTTASIRRTHRRTAGRASRGFTLVELMVAITLGLFILIGLISLLVSNVVSRSELDKSSRQIESGRYAIQLLTEDLQNAGYVGFSAKSTGSSFNPPIGCPATVSDLGYVPGTPAVPLPLYGLAVVPGCISNVKASTAMLVVSRVNTNAIATTAKVSTETYLQVSSCDNITPPPPPFAVDTGAAAFPLLKKDCTTPEVLRKVVQHVYFVAACDVCSGPGTDTTPTLKMAEYVNGTMIITPLVEGIENLQFDYGIDTDGDGAPDCYTSDPSTPTTVAAACPAPYVGTNATTNWSYVRAVRVHVLARNTEASAGWVDAKTYDMGLAPHADGTVGPVGPFNDAIKRHVYSAVVRLYNSSGQWESP